MIQVVFWLLGQKCARAVSTSGAWVSFGKLREFRTSWANAIDTHNALLPLHTLMLRVWLFPRRLTPVAVTVVILGLICRQFENWLILKFGQKNNALLLRLSVEHFQSLVIQLLFFETGSQQVLVAKVNIFFKFRFFFTSWPQYLR